MSTFTFPYWAKPVLDFYNLKWPDVDEDKVAELGGHIQDLANASWLFCVAVKSALGTLNERSEAEALSAFHDSWGDYTDSVVCPVTEAVGQTAVSTTLGVANAITVYKGGLLGVLTFHAASDIALIATGAGAAVTVAKKALMREVLENAMTELAVWTASKLVDQWNEAVDQHILGPIEDLAREIGADLGGAVSRVVGTAIDPIVQGVGGAGASLYIDEHEVLDAVIKVKGAVANLKSAASGLAGWTKGTGYTVPTPAPDPTVSFEIKQAFDWFADAFVAQLEALADEVVDRVVLIITSTYEKYVEADSELGRLAAQLREQFVVAGPARPFVIDRSTRPAPITIASGPPPIVTGLGISDAYENIVAIDLPDAPDPVITGVAQSDARLSIRQIVLSQPETWQGTSSPDAG